MLPHQLADSTKSSYATKWTAFMSFCQVSGYLHLPTTPEVVACYIGDLYERGTIATGTLQSYLTPINAVHSIFQMDKPAVGPMLMAVRHGFARLYANHQGGLRNKRVPLPAAALTQMVALALTTTDPGLRRRVAGLTLTALTFSRPGEGANLRRKDVTLTPALMRIQIPDYKHGACHNRERLNIRIPRRAAGLQDGAWDLVHQHITAMRLATADPDQPLFTTVGDVTPLPTEVATVWMRECLYLLNINPPDGCVYSGHSLRGCAATSARSIGYELDLIATLMGMKDKDTTKVSANYVDALAQPDVHARELYDRYRVDRR